MDGNPAGAQAQSRLQRFRSLELFESFAAEAERLYVTIYAGRALIQETRRQIEEFTARLDEGLRQNTRAALEILSTVEFGNRFVSHSLKVALLSLMLADRLGLPDSRRLGLGIASLLHDLGKNVSQNPLINSYMRGTTEQELQRHHPAVGAALAGEYLGFSGEIAQYILRHHEQADGGGFPSGLTLAQTTLADRILFTANFVDNLLGLSGYSGETVLAGILPETFAKHGAKFDPVLSEAFLEIVRRPVVSRRGAVRHAIGLPALFQMPGLPSRLSCRILDISATGLRIRGREQLHPGQQIRVSFVLGGTLTVNDFPVRVVRHETDEKGEVYGLQFLGEETENGLRQRIATYLQRLGSGRPSA